MPARAFTTYRSAGPVLPEFLSNLKNLFKVAYIYPYDVSAARTQNSKDFFTVKVILVITVESLNESGLYLEFGICDQDSIRVRTLFKKF